MPTFEMPLVPIGTVRSTRKALRDDGWDAETVAVVLDSDQFGPGALAGLGAFSHVEVLFLMNQVDPGKIEKDARHPRSRADWPEVGIFAQRGKNRPNRIGTTICRIEEVDGLEVRVRGLDAVDGTPVLDLKPWVREFGPRGAVHQPDWMNELMAGYF